MLSTLRGVPKIELRLDPEKLGCSNKSTHDHLAFKLSKLLFSEVSLNDLTDHVCSIKNLKDLSVQDFDGKVVLSLHNVCACSGDIVNYP